MTVLSILLSVICIIALAIWGVDLYYHLLDRYCRFHIGRWPDVEEWKKAVTNCALQWIRKTPTVKLTDNSRYILLDVLRGKYRSNKVQSWQVGGLLLGVENTKSLNCRDWADKVGEKILDGDGGFCIRPTTVDFGLLAYAILRRLDPQRVKLGMDDIAELIRNNVAGDGMIAYTSKESDERYVDTIGLCCPFLACYARVYERPEYARLAVSQLEQFSQYGLHPESLLPNHAYSRCTELPLGVYGWGRGTGWYVLGLIDTYFELTDEEDIKWCREQIRRVADAYMAYQRPDGGFGHILQMQKGYDSSATAVLAYFYRRAAGIFDYEAYEEVADRCLDKLRSVTRITGAVDWCQGDTKGIGVFAQTYDIMPFAQGMTLRAINLGEIKK